MYIYIHSHTGVDRTWKFQTYAHFSEDFWKFTYSICSRMNLSICNVKARMPYVCIRVHRVWQALGVHYH